jgi:hypothetical protein
MGRTRGNVGRALGVRILKQEQNREERDRAREEEAD